MLGGSASFRAKQFVTEANKSTMVYEVKRVRAVWDPSLSIPGTDRRGGWRCPEGTRYGGQITDRFGRQCGWGLVRRIANMVSNVGEALEDRDDRRRARRGGKRRVVSPATPELDTPNLDLNENDSALAESLGEVVPTPEPPKPRTVKPRRVTNVDTPEAVEPKPEQRPRRAPRRRPQGNLRPSEQRRMERELEQPGAPRTGLEEPSVEQVLTPEQASDAVATEEFRPYVLRKYNEYARNVRKIREEGGDAGMLTRREWYAINKDNLRSAWKDVHGVDAPDSFEPPTPQPRRPRRRRQRAVEESASTRSPSLRNDKEPVAVEPKPEPKMPSRPKKPASVRPTGAQDRPRRPVPPTPADWVVDGEDTWKLNAWTIYAIRNESGDFLRFDATTPQGKVAYGRTVDELIEDMNRKIPPTPADWVVDGDNRWRWGNWYITSYADEDGNFVRFSAWTSNNKYAEGASVDELIEEMRKPKVFESLDEALNEIGFEDFFNDRVFGLRTQILNDATNFPERDANKRRKAEFAIDNMREIQGVKDVLNRALAENRVSADDMVRVRGAIELTMDEVLLNLDATQEAWKFVRDANTNLPQQSEFQLDGGWNKVGENKWEKGGIELELGFVNGEVVSGRITNRAIGAIYEQGFDAGQSQVQNFVDDLYKLAGGQTFPSVVPPNAKKKPQLRKGRKPISEETKRNLANTGNLHYFNTNINGHEALVYGPGYRNAYEVASAHTNRIKEQIEVLGNNARMGHISQARDGVVGYNERLAFIQEAAETAGLTDDDYFLLADNTTISIGEIKSNIIKARDEVQSRFDFLRDNYWATRGKEAITGERELERALGQQNWNLGYEARENFIAYMAMHDYDNFENLLTINVGEANPDALDFLKKQSALPRSERNYERIYMVIQSLGEKQHQAAYFNNIEDSEVSELLGLPNDFDYGTITALDEAIAIAESKDLDISTKLAEIARKLTREQTTNERNELLADFIRLDNDRFFYRTIAENLTRKKNPLLEQQRLEQASFDRDLAISNFEILPEFEADNLNQLLTLAERAEQLLGGARDADRDQDFRNPAGAVGRAVVAIDEALRGKSEDQQLEYVTELLNALSMDGSIKRLNDAIEKFKISPTRKQLKELRRQTLETIKTKATINYLGQTMKKLTAPHRLDLNKLDQLFNHIETTNNYNEIPEYLRKIFLADFDRYGDELATPDNIAESIRARRAEIRNEFNLIPNSPRGINQMDAMVAEQESRVFDANEDFIAVFNEVARFTPAGDLEEDKARIQEIAARLSQVAKMVAVRKLELEEIKREAHSKRSAMANRQIPQSPIHILFGGRPEDHSNGINKDNITERIASVAGEISDRKISKYITDLDDAFRKLEQFDDDEIIRFPQGDINVADAKKAIQEASSAYQFIKISRTNNPDTAVFTPRISDMSDASESQLVVSPISQEASNIPENHLALIKDAMLGINNEERTARINLALDEIAKNVDLSKVEALTKFVYEINRKLNELNIRPGDMSAAEKNQLLDELDNFLKENAGINLPLDDLVYYEADTEKFKLDADDALDEIRKAKQEFADGTLDQSAYDRRIENLTSEYISKMTIYQQRKDRIALFNWAQTEMPKIVERKLRGLDMSNGDITDPLSDDEVELLARKVKNKIKKAVARRLDVLQAYINENYSEDFKPWDITPELWNDDMDDDEKVEYLRKAYSPEMIRGSNGRIYSAVADVSDDGRGEYTVSVEVFEVDENGNHLRSAGDATRVVNVRQQYVYNQNFFLERSPVDRGAGIQTVFNQHAFMFLNSIGVKKATVSTARDGQYVWARIGFVEEQGIYSGSITNMIEQLDRYRNLGGIGIIQNDAEYRRIQALVKKYQNDSRSVTHQDFIFAFDDNGDKLRALRIKEFFKRSMPMSSGALIFGDQPITRTPGDAARDLMDEVNMNGG